MNSGIGRALWLAPALAGILGSILGTRALKQAMTTCQSLYQVDNAGSQIESDLEFETQESRRAFLYAIATQDPNEQLPYIDQSREASQRVWDTAHRMRLLGAPEVGGWVDDLNSAGRNIAPPGMKSWRTFWKGTFPRPSARSARAGNRNFSRRWRVCIG